jgi:hypothetical protein
MKTWLIVPQNRTAELDEINSRFTDRMCTTHETNDGVLLSNSDKLGDIYWSGYHAFLSSLAPFEGDPVWPVQETQIATEDEPS